jgi:signal transduction histidine kinase
MKSVLTTRRRVGAGLMLCAFSVGVWLMYVVKLGPLGLWPCSGFLAAALFTTRGRVSWFIALAAGLAELGVVLRGGAPLLSALCHAQWDVSESAGAALLARRALGARALLRTPTGFLRLQALAVFPACVLAVLIFICEIKLFHLRFDWSIEKSALAHLLGMATVLPAMLLIVQPALPNLRRSWRETVSILGGVALIVLFVSHQVGPPALILTPTLLFATFRLGPRGAAMSSLILSLLALPVVISGGGPFGLHPEWGLSQRIGIFQVTVLSLLFGVTLVAFILAQQVRMTHLLERRAEIARAARRRALQASRAKTEFLATMSHEVRTPMNSILGFAELLRRDPRLPPDLNDKVGIITVAGRSLMGLLGDVLDFSKIEAGQIELHLESVDLIEASRDAVNAAAPNAEAKGLLIGFEADAGAVGQFHIDPLRLRQILLNLLGNAVKFTAHGEVRLSVSRVGADADRPMIRFAVTDTGIGIDPDVMSRLFTRFSQADSSITRTYGGTGLGLAICKGLVERMDGRIGVDSRPGSGSTFWFEAPLERAGAADDEQRADAAAERLPLNASVLLVDDHPVNRQLGQALLEMLGCRVDLAEDGEQAVAAASRGVAV